MSHEHAQPMTRECTVTVRATSLAEATVRGKQVFTTPCVDVVDVIDTERQVGDAYVLTLVLRDRPVEEAIA